MKTTKNDTAKLREVMGSVGLREDCAIFNDLRRPYGYRRLKVWNNISDVDKIAALSGACAAAFGDRFIRAGAIKHYRNHNIFHFYIKLTA